MRKSDYTDKEKAFQSEFLRNGFFGDDVGLGYWHIDENTIVPNLRFILAPASSNRNLYDPIRKEAVEYFERYDIAWWKQFEDRYFPTGHLLSSQIHCLNYLFTIIKNLEAVLAMIQPIGTAAGISFDKVLLSLIDTKEGLTLTRMQANLSPTAITFHSNLFVTTLICWKSHTKNVEPNVLLLMH